VRIVPGRPAVEADGAAAPERELKFLVPESRAAFIAGWLRGVCARDPSYPPARVVTVYFDTARLDLLDEKINSDYLKTKVRVRWYERPDGSMAGESAFVEAKRRVGSTRGKMRRRLEVPASTLAGWPLDHSGWPSLLDPLRTEADLPADLGPVIRLSYMRERLVDRIGGGRVAIDTAISVDAVNPRRPRPGLPGRVPGALVEYKGRTLDLPPHLRRLTDSGGRRASFSKYLAAYLHATGTRL
jgi:hypothetical protein